MDGTKEQLNRVFAALADPTRRDLVARLAMADSTVGELAEPHEMTFQAISKHIKVLEAAKLVTRRRRANRRLVHLDASALELPANWIALYRAWTPPPRLTFSHPTWAAEPRPATSTLR